jgi:L-arabinokinase
LIEFAQYRNRNVDAGIVQPKAYDVDRQKTLEGLQGFLYERDTTLKEEVKWLKSEKIDAVLSDATFLGW